MTDQDPAVIVEHIRDGAESEITHPDNECGVEAGGFCTPHGAVRLAAAVEAVLKLADRYDTIPAYGPTPATRHQVARSFREAVTRELTGEEGSDGHGS